MRRTTTCCTDSCGLRSKACRVADGRQFCEKHLGRCPGGIRVRRIHTGDGKQMSARASMAAAQAKVNSVLPELSWAAGRQRVVDISPAERPTIRLYHQPAQEFPRSTAEPTRTPGRTCGEWHRNLTTHDRLRWRNTMPAKRRRSRRRRRARRRRQGHLHEWCAGTDRTGVPSLSRRQRRRQQRNAAHSRPACRLPKAATGGFSVQRCVRAM